MEGYRPDDDLDLFGLARREGRLRHVSDNASGERPRTMTSPDTNVAAELAAELAKRGIELGPVVGRGAMAVVHRAFDARHNRSLAVKVLSQDVADSDAAARWTREVSAVARLRHPNILPLIDSGTTASGARYFLMPFADGETLRARIERAPLPIGEAVRCACDIAEALACAHAEGLVHRDVKPANVLLEGGRAVLTDFGLARQLESAASPLIHPTQVGQVVGTPAYMSPEQLMPSGALDGRADLFSLGVTLYEMLTGRLPFRSTNMPGLLTERLAGRFEPLATACPAAPALLERVVARALAADPEERHASAQAMVDELKLVERQLSGAMMTPRPRSKPPYRIWLAGGLFALVSVIMVLRARMPTSRRLDTNRIVVADFRNETGDTMLAATGDMVGDWISAGLTAVPGITVINAEYVLGAQRRTLDRRIASAPGAELRTLVDATHAGTVVSGSIFRESGALEVFAEVTDANTGRVLLDLGPFRGSAARPDSAFATARDSITAFIRGRRGSGR